MAEVEFYDNDSDQDEGTSRSASQRRPASRQQSGRSFDNDRRRTNTFRRRRKVCAFCSDKSKTIDWKDHESLRRFIGDGGSIRARRKTGTCAKHQRRLAIAVKRARHLALLPFTSEHARLANKS